MNVLMLNPPFAENFCRSARWAARSRGRVQRHPDWMLIAAAVLEESGHKVKFVDGAALNLGKKDIEAEIDLLKPDLAVLHTTTPTIYSDISYAEFIKDKAGCITALIGPHVSVEVKNTFDLAEQNVDAVVRGEYDYTLRDLACGKLFRDIPGISYIENGIIKDNPDRPLLNVNELPYPAWHQIDPRWYYDAGKRFPFLTLISGRGCFGLCTFCRDTPLMYKRNLRLRRAELVVDEIEHDYKLFPYIKEIMFETDTFVASPEHVRGICEEILRRNLNICWSCNSRVDMDLSLLPIMKKAGCRMLMTGFEFGTQGALDAVKKGITLEQSRQFASAAHRLGFIIHGCFMFGAPGETEESCRKTIEFAKSLPLDTVQFSGICTYPGTEIYRWVSDNGYLVPKDWSEWVGEDFEQKTLINYPRLTKQQIDNFIDTGLREFYLRPKQIFSMVFNINSFSDLKRKIYGLSQFIDYFIRLSRRLHISRREMRKRNSRKK
jgi:radical SAM superfamily enzyme YgiQ (UPF0313 family)